METETSLTKRLSDPQFMCLWGIALGSGGESSNKRTLQSLRRRGLIHGMEHQGGWQWFTTDAGDVLLDSDPRRQ